MMVIYWDDKNIIKKNIVALIDVSEKVGLEENTKKTKYMLTSRY
jgi:hypothetical protein